MRILDARKQYKTIRAFQNNGPDYWLIFRGVRTFGADPICSCNTEEEARLIVAALNGPEPDTTL